MSYEFILFSLFLSHSHSFFLSLRDSLFANTNRQPAPPSATPVSTFWQAGVHPHVQEMEYQYSVAPPTHITSPPTTPMTPGPHHVTGGGGFSLAPHCGSTGLPFQRYTHVTK